MSNTVIGCDRNKTDDDNRDMKWADRKWKLVMFSVKTSFGHIFESTNYHII